jgi:YggT family protein
MLNQITAFLIQTTFGLLVFLALLRFYMQLFRAPFRNPIGQFVVALTDWAVLPLRRVVPSFRGYDLASLSLAWLAELVMLALLYLFVHRVALGSLIGIMLLQSFIELVRASLQLLIFIVLVQVVLSWVAARHPLMPVFDCMTRPFYGVFRRFVPPIGNIDLSPLLVVVLAQVVLIVLENVPRALLVASP